MRPSPKVEIAFDLSAAGNGDFFTLNDPIKGELDNTIYPLAGDILTDVTTDVRGLSIRRGRSRELDKYQAGSLDVTLDNRDRDYDPTNDLDTGTRLNQAINPSFEVDLSGYDSASSYFESNNTGKVGTPASRSVPATLPDSSLVDSMSIKSSTSWKATPMRSPKSCSGPSPQK